jgi:hypothetical protein
MLSMLLLLFAFAHAGAHDPVAAASPVADPASAVAAYRQQAWELHRLAERDAWAGVERAYVQMVAQELPLQADEHLIGANSAQALGNAAETRIRLGRAHALREDREVIEWMFRLDESFGAVRIVDERRRRPRLAAARASFMPDATRAVAFAVSSVETGIFEGLLPVGTYHYGNETFEVTSDKPVVIEHLR